MQTEEVLKSMIGVLANNRDCGYTQSHVDMCKAVLAEFDKGLSGASGDYKKIMKCVKKTVLGLNKADKKAKYSLIKPIQSEALRSYIHSKAYEAGLKDTGQDITELWSDW